MDWFRWHTGSTTDPKFRVVARRAAQAVPGVRLSDVLAVWAMLLERASEADERGMIEGYDCEGADAHLDLPDGAACAIVKALQDKGLITPDRVSRWDQRQPKREDATATDRKRAQRERERNANEQSVTHGHARSQSVTHGHDRGEEIRGDKKEELNNSSSYSSSAAADDSASSLPPCPTSAIIAAYHAILPERPVVKFPGKKLLQHLKARMAEDPSRRSVEWWEEYFRDVRGKPWLMGQGDWAGANLHWLVGPENMSKVLNGQYDERKTSSSALDTWKPKELRQ